MSSALRWVIQTNLGSSKDAEAFARACEQAGHVVERLVRAPFDAGPPAVSNDHPTVFYGAGSLVQAVAAAGRWSPGVWSLDEDYGDWVEHYGAHMLNAGARFLTLAELAEDASLAADEGLHFARPSADTKLFAGQVAAGSAHVAWARRALGVAEAGLDPNTALLLAEPVGIRAEWRLFAVDGRVVTGSRYRSYQRLTVSSELPSEVVEFAEARLREHAPVPVLVMDVGRSGEALYIIELNGFNSAGFYAADLGLLARAIAAFVAQGSASEGA